MNWCVGAPLPNSLSVAAGISVRILVDILVWGSKGLGTPKWFGIAGREVGL